MPVGFSRSKGLGKWAERQVKNHLEKKQEHLHTVDVSETEKFQPLGIDFVWIAQTPENGIRAFLIDVKMDRLIARTGNIFFETLSGVDAAGNLLTSVADVFMYLDPFGKELYHVNVRALREWWLKNQAVIPIKIVRSKTRVTKGFCMTTELILGLGFAYKETIYIEGGK